MKKIYRISSVLYFFIILASAPVYDANAVTYDDYKAAVAKDPLPKAYRQQQQIYTEALRRTFPERQIGFEFWWLVRAED